MGDWIEVPVTEKYFVKDIHSSSGGTLKSASGKTTLVLLAFHDF